MDKNSPSIKLSKNLLYIICAAKKVTEAKPNEYKLYPLFNLYFMNAARKVTHRVNNGVKLNTDKYGGGISPLPGFIKQYKVPIKHKPINIIK